MVGGAMYRLGYVRSIHEFTPVQVLMELKKGTGMKTETVEQFMSDVSNLISDHDASVCNKIINYTSIH